MGQANKWGEFWKNPYQIKASRKNIDAHYRFLGQHFVSYFKNLEGKKVFSFGCGEAGEIPWILNTGAKVYLYDQSPVFEKIVREKFGSNPQVHIVTEQEWFRPLDERFDLIYVSSVIQYLSLQEFQELLTKLLMLLAPNGQIAIIDVISKKVTPFQDTLDFLKISFSLGFWWSGMKTIINLLRSDYMKTRETTGFTKYDYEDMAELVAPFGLKIVDQPRNLCLSALRQTFILGR